MFAVGTEIELNLLFQPTGSPSKVSRGGPAAAGDEVCMYPLYVI